MLRDMVMSVGPPEGGVVPGTGSAGSDAWATLGSATVPSVPLQQVPEKLSRHLMFLTAAGMVPITRILSAGIKGTFWANTAVKAEPERCQGLLQQREHGRWLCWHVRTLPHNLQRAKSTPGEATEMRRRILSCCHSCTYPAQLPLSTWSIVKPPH